MSQQQKTISLVQPEAGQIITIPVDAANMRLTLGFAPDPNAVEKNGQNLEFSFEDGGKIVLEGYYDHFTSKTLPVMVVESGDELSGEDFLASLREDLLTAAGPSASAGAGSGGSGDYADDAGALIGGVNKLGSLEGTLAWSNAGATEIAGTGLVGSGVLPPPVGGTVELVIPGGSGGSDGSSYFIGGQGYNLRIDESYMPGGSNNSSGGVPVHTLTFLITSDSGVATVSVDGVTYTVENGALASFTGVTGGSGTLTNAQLVDNGDNTFTLTFNYTQSGAYTHSGSGKDIADNADSFTIAVGNANGDTAGFAANIDIVDDVPTVSIKQGVVFSAQVTVDESAIGAYDDGKISSGISASDVQALFSATEYGVDGQGAADSYSLSFTGSNVPTGIYAVAEGGGQGSEIVLNMVNGTIVATADGVAQFTIKIDPATGEVTLNLLNNIWHPNAGTNAADHDESVTMQLPADVLAVVKTVTDGDGDTASASYDIGAAAAFVFEDDGPILTLNHTGNEIDGMVSLGNSFMTSGSFFADYGADEAAGGVESITMTFEGTRHAKSGSEIFETSFSETVEVVFDSAGKASVHTGLGLLELTKQGNGVITYTYLAKQGLQGDSETFTFTIKDGDGDTAVQNMGITIAHDVPAGTSLVDEAGLAGLGSHHLGYNEAHQTFDVFLPEGTESIEWNVDAINANASNHIKADVNGDGTYTQVTWSVDGDGNLIAEAEGATILKVTPGTELEDVGQGLAGTFEVELFYPVQHGPNGSETDTAHGLNLEFKAVAEGGLNIDSALSVAIVDDVPNALTLPMDVTEAVATPQDIYLIMDVSVSLSDNSLALGMRALLAMAEKYQAEGIDAVFTLSMFGQTLSQWGDNQMSVTELLDLLHAGIDGKTDSQIATYFRAGTNANWTDYDFILDYTQELIQVAQQDGTYRYYDQKVFFISDGIPTTGHDQYFNSWKKFTSERQGEEAGHNQVEVYSIGVGISTGNIPNVQAVTADDYSDHYINVSNYKDLANALINLVQPGVTTGRIGADTDNNDVDSADLTTVISISYKGEEYPVPEGGSTEIILEADAEGNALVKLVMNSNGTYSLSSYKSVDATEEFELTYTIKDADGDTSSATFTAVLRDAAPEAVDNVASGPDHAYNEPVIVLDDFGVRTGDAKAWYSANTAITYNAKLSGISYTDIDGNPAITNSSQSFVQMSATASYNSSYASFADVLYSLSGGKTAVDLFGVSTNTANYGSMIQQSYDLHTSGTISFNYYLDRSSNTVSNAEYGFAVLKNEKGEIIWSGLLSSVASGDVSGLCTIDVPNAGNYTLYIGCYSTTTYSTKLYVEQVVFATDSTGDVYHGNMIEDASPLGAVDTFGDQAVLHQIRVTGLDGEQVYTVGQGEFVDGLLVLTDVFAQGDKLTINANGKYSYETTGEGDSFDNVNIEYALKEPGSDDIDWGTVYIRSEDHLFENAADGSQHTDGNDAIIGIDAGVTLDGGAGDDVIYGGAGDDVIYGGEGDDTIYGGAGNDHLYGGTGNDAITGGAGNDFISGGAGDDTLSGGSGADVFVWRGEDYGGTDVVLDFTLLEDRLSLGDLFPNSDGANNISINSILEALNDDRLDISVDADGSALSVRVNTGSATQNVEIHLSNSVLTAEQVADIAAGDDAAKAILLQQMLTGVTG